MLAEVSLEASQELVASYISVLKSSTLRVTEGEVIDLFKSALKVVHGAPVMMDACESCSRVQTVADRLSAGPKLMRMRELGTGAQVKTCFETAVALLEASWEVGKG